ncbi:NepR family anti-sigma factor [Sedimentitalea sp. JM2-8]|uniref:NepR family anti-sigma factor n=1 Tax=Sedimentitalea xiamensis TaxID=3050037 RepID=A0ABT7FIL2_9RHOB|nr:NepR family anti-sigma factor [Sedimentitalea xiamensis]MDK3074977.1 NepR family anti-sigma factor [Sedimentitalea xiamensis]
MARNLRRIYQETADEPVPGRLLELLEKLRAQDQEETSDNSNRQDGSAE